MSKPWIAVLFLLGIVAWVSSAFVLARQDKRETLESFMKRKLEHCQGALRGIVLDDMDLVAKHAQGLSLLSMDESWNVIQTPEYLERSNEFRRSVNGLARAARDKHPDTAALLFVQMTMQCFDCHRALREK